MRKVRDTALAHNDICKLDDDFDMWSGTDIVFGDIHALIEYGADVINNYSYYSDNTAHSIKATNKLDVEFILRALENKCRGNEGKYPEV